MANNRLMDLRNPSRHEQVEEPEVGIPSPPFRWKTRVALPGALLGGLVALLLVTGYSEVVPAVAVNASPVVAKKVSGPVAGAVTVQAAGWVEADPYKSYVTALTDGIVKEVPVLEGDPVQKDQVVARLVDDDAKLAHELTQARVRELEAALLSTRADLTAAKEEWENPVERNRSIGVFDAQVAESKATLEQLTAEIDVEAAQLEHAKSQNDRFEGLFQSNSISEADLIRVRSQYHAQKAKLAATKARQIAVKELIPKYEAELLAAKELMRLRTEERRKLDHSQAAVIKAEATLQQAKTTLAEAKLRLERMEIRSSMDGTVMRRLTVPGSKVLIAVDNAASARVLSLYDPNRLQVRVDVPLGDAAKIGVGQLAEITVEVLPDRTFSGTVTRVLHEANIQKNTLEVKVAIANPEPQLRPEMLARVRFLAKVDPAADQEKARVFAPDAALRRNGGTTTAWVIRDFNGDRGIASARPVQVGTLKSEGWVEVPEGLQPGDLIVTRSPRELKNGERVRVIGE
ncbi:MAG: efflux RND transporter periplasmic adaptor subunit [Desulfomonile tiedjei]|nr:efflux RND transporter periplasmic adaptor subunit [Desulfomonile tiedjei]